LDPLSAQHAKDDHKRVEEVLEVPQRDLIEVLRCVIAAKQLHPNDSEYEDDDGQNEAEITQSPQSSANYVDQ
jgi:hypothetical protein